VQREVFAAKVRQNDRAYDCIVQKSGEVMRRKQSSHTAKMRSKLSLRRHKPYLANMFDTISLAHLPKPAQYEALATQAHALMAGEHNLIANAANLSALVMSSLPALNWAGFYLYDGTELVLGPFQGKPACLRIALNRGVCGKAATTGQTQLVPDVHAFPGHIACDAASRSELVVPLLHQGKLLGVWDVDSPVLNRFDAIDQNGMQALCKIFLSSLLPE
jgi:GAF domain-containing protein